MTQRLLVWCFIALIAFLCVAGGLGLYPVLSPEDPSGLARSLVLRVSTMLIGFAFLLLTLIAFDFVTPSDWFLDIEKHPMAVAVTVAALILALALIFIYS